MIHIHPRNILSAVTLAWTILLPSILPAQNKSESSATTVTRSNIGNVVTSRRDSHDNNRRKNTADTRWDAPNPNVEWMRIIYRQIDLDNEKNAALYYPELPIEGKENLFRLILRLITEGQIDGYEYLDGREVFTGEFKINRSEFLDRFHIPYTEKKGSGNRPTLYEIDENDVPASDVLSYYFLEQWEFDNIKGRTTTKVLAVCPILHETGDFGNSLKYPMLWVKMDDLRLHLKNTSVFVNDNDNSPQYSYDDFFVMNFYDGEVYKTRNVRNKSMMQLYPDEDARKQASDSILNRLKRFDKSLWVPTREEIMEARKAKEELGAIPERKKKESSSRRKPTRSRGYKPTDSSGNNNTIRSVKDRK
ncbi:MAG: gliding motility protein GldN [Muribaculaceae bacterium]|nr:gliding motility protein GldN [Muribaculaceae bacterium]